MQVTPLWQKFKQLGILDKQILLGEETYGEVVAKIKTLRHAVVEHDAILNRMTIAHKKLAHEVALREADINAALEQIKAKEKQLENAASQKQQAAFEHEISTLKKSLSSFEDQCLELLSQLEQYSNFMLHDAPALREQIKQQQEEIITLENSIQQTLISTTNNKAEQAAIITTITPEWFAKYQEMKTHVADPIAPVIRDACGACFYEVLAQDLVRLKKNAILPCQSCFRLLYCDIEIEISKEKVEVSK